MTTIITELDNDTVPLPVQVENTDLNELDINYWVDFTANRSMHVLPEDADEADKPGNLHPRMIANAVYKRKYSYLPTYYTEVYEYFPLLVAAELAKKKKIIGGKTLRPRYLSDIVSIYTDALGNRWKEKTTVPYYGVLSISMCAVLGYVELAIELANRYPILLNKKKQPGSLRLFLQIVSEASMTGREQQLSSREIHKNIQEKWINLLSEYYPLMLSSWENTPNFERV